MDEIKIKALIDAADSAKTIQELKKALRDLKSAAVEVGDASEYFDEITRAAGSVNDRIGDLNSQVKALGDDLFKLRGVVQIGQGIAAGFSIAQGAAGLFGGESEQLEKTLLKVNSAMALVNGAMAIGEILQKESTAVLLTQNIVRGVTVGLVGKEAVAKAQLAVANGTATITQRALNAAMTANPVGILITAIAGLVAAYYAFAGSSDEAAEAAKRLNDQLEFQNELRAERQKQALTDAEYMKKLAESEGADAKKLAEMDKKILKDKEKMSRENLAAETKNIKTLQKRRSELRDQGFDDDDEEIKNISALIDKSIERKNTEVDNLRVMSNGMNKYQVEAQIIDNKLTQEQKKEQAKRLKEHQKTNDKKVEADKKFVVDVRKLNEVIYQNNIDIQEALLSTWQDTYDKKILAQLSAEAKSNKQALDLQTNFLEQLQKDYLASKEFTDLKISVTGIDDVKFQTAWKNFLASNNAEAIKASKAIARVETSTQQTLTAIQEAGANAREQIAKDEKDALIKIYNETTRVVLAQDEYRRFYEFLGTQTRKYSRSIAGVGELFDKSTEKIKASIEEQIQAQEKLIKAKEAEIEVDKKKDEVSMEQNRTMLEMGTITQQDYDDTVKRNEKNLQDHRDKIKAANDEIAKLKEVITLRQEQKAKFEADTKSVLEGNHEVKTSNIDINKTIEDFNKVLRAARDAKKQLSESNPIFGKSELKELAKAGDDIWNLEMSIEGFTKAVDNLSKGKALDWQDYSKAIVDMTTNLENLPEEVQKVGSTMTSVGQTVKVELEQSLWEVEKTVSGYKVTTQVLENSIIDQARTIFDTRRDINKSQIADSLKTTVMTTAIYKDKNDTILKQEEEITQAMQAEAKKRIRISEDILKNGKKDETGAIVMPTDAERAKLEEIIKKNKELQNFKFRINPINADELGLDKLGVEFSAQLEQLNKKLIERRDQIIKLEQAVYDEDLFALFKELDAKVITQKEYDKQAEELRLNHEQNMLGIQVAYGEKGQQDFVQNAKERRDFVKLQKEKEKAELMTHLETLFQIEKQAADLYMQWWMQQNAEQDRASQKRYDDRIDLIDAEQQAYDDAIANRTAAEQQAKDIEDEFALRRQQAEDERKKEQNDLAEKAFEAQKMNSIAQIAIEYALAIAKAWGTAGPFGAPMAYFLGAQGILAASLVASQKFVPQYATGGLVTGPGGPTDDKVPAMLSNGEVVINAKSSKMFSPILSKINQAGGGVPIPKLGNGPSATMHAAQGGVAGPQAAMPGTMVVELGGSSLSDLQTIFSSQQVYVKEDAISNAQEKKAKVDSRTKF